MQKCKSAKVQLHTNETNLEFMKRTVSEIQRLDSQFSTKLYQAGKELNDEKLYQNESEKNLSP